MRALLLVAILGACKHPPTTYELVGLWMSKAYTLTPIDGATLRLEYQTPCGKQALNIPIGEEEPDDGGVVRVRMPPGHELPVHAVVRLDPELKAPVKLGAIAIEHSQFDVLSPECGAKLTIGDTTFDIPPLQKRHIVDDPYPRETLFVTARPEQCFLDQLVTYGSSDAGKGTRLQGKNVYWLTFATYEFWFTKIAKTTTVRSYGTSSMSFTVKAAFTTCEQGM